VLSSPWIVLSSGVAPATFPAAVEAACIGEADGFLAGQTMWAHSVGAGDLPAHLVLVATARLGALITLVHSGGEQRK
jgi:sulfofructosephosphate aldolase